MVNLIYISHKRSPFHNATCQPGIPLYLLYQWLVIRDLILI